jgi:hypothetical protein
LWTSGRRIRPEHVTRRRTISDMRIDLNADVGEAMADSSRG